MEPPGGHRASHIRPTRSLITPPLADPEPGKAGDCEVASASSFGQSSTAAWQSKLAAAQGEVAKWRAAAEEAAARAARAEERIAELTGAAPVRSEVNSELNFPSNFEGLVLGCIDADFCK